MYPRVHCSIIYSSQDREATKMSISNEWIKKYYLAKESIPLTRVNSSEGNGSIACYTE